MVAVLVIVASSAAAPAVTVRTNVSVATSSAGVVQVIGPSAPTAGVVQSHPTGLFSDTNDVPFGTAMVSVTSLANSGPLLLASTV